jgi:hypothetical protein
MELRCFLLRSGSETGTAALLQEALTSGRHWNSQAVLWRYLFAGTGPEPRDKRAKIDYHYRRNPGSTRESGPSLGRMNQNA